MQVYRRIGRQEHGIVDDEIQNRVGLAEPIIIE